MRALPGSQHPGGAFQHLLINMKFRLLPALLLLAAAWFFLTNARREPNNPPTGRTGAPGETTCAESTCHSGGGFIGSVSLSGIPDTVISGQSYIATLTNTSNAVRAGFELTCLDGSNAMCGSLVATAGVSIGSGSGGRKYARQSSPKTLSNGSTSWNFTWKAPAQPTSDSARFYFVSLCANGNGNKTGDNVLMATKKVVFQILTPTNEPGKTAAVSVYPTLVEKILHVDLLESTGGKLTILDMQGKQLITVSTLEARNEVNVGDLRAGSYIAVVKTAGKTATRKFVVL